MVYCCVPMIRILKKKFKIIIIIECCVKSPFEQQQKQKNS